MTAPAREPQPVADPADLRLATFDELAVPFRLGEAPMAGELDGVYRGRVVALAGIDRVPMPARRVLDLLLRSRLVPWYGKRFDAAGESGRRGVNVWLTSMGPNLFPYRIESTERACVLDYDIPANLPPLRRIHGEIVRLAPGLYLGRMTVLVGESTPTVLYFTLENG